MAWKIYDDKLCIIGEKHYNSEKLRELIDKLEKQESHKSKKICSILEKFLYEGILCKKHIWQLTKWCNWSHKKAEKTAQELFSELFYDIKLDRLLDKENNPEPSEKEANDKYNQWLKKLENKQKILEDELKEDEQTKKKILNNLETNNIDDLLRVLDEEMKNTSFKRRISLLNKIIRSDHKIIRLIKEKYNQCQFPDCNARIPKENGTNYVEVAHIVPVHKGGLSNLGNLIVLCPNHHKEFDLGQLKILTNDDDFIEGLLNDNLFKIEKIKLNF